MVLMMHVGSAWSDLGGKNCEEQIFSCVLMKSLPSFRGTSRSFFANFVYKKVHRS